MFQVSITDQSWPLLAPLPPPDNSQNIICNNKPLLAKYLRGSDEACKLQREEPSSGLMLSTQTVIKQFYNSTVTCPPIFTTCLQTSKTVFYILQVKANKIFQQFSIIFYKLIIIYIVSLLISKITWFICKVKSMFSFAGKCKV